MMETPILDFVMNYSSGQSVRAHMPGHKGNFDILTVKSDITEIHGADSLYEADGIILKSEKNAAELFGSGATYFSTEGSSQCIKAMLFSVCSNSGKRQPHILAARNVHTSFISAAALIDFRITWLPCRGHSYFGGTVTPSEVEDALKKSDFDAVYITSPNYLGEICDISGISAVTKQFKVPLIVDNAHGAYLKYFGNHPISLGADMCCDSAHKTLPSLTGGAYLHLSKSANEEYGNDMRSALLLFGSTSPSYLVLASLDACNIHLKDGKKEAHEFAEKVQKLKSAFIEKGFTLVGDEPWKITVLCDGIGLSRLLRENNIECEFADSQALVMMLTPQNESSDLVKIEKVIKKLPHASYPPAPEYTFSFGKQAISIRKAAMSKHEKVRTADSLGRICAQNAISCPPAAPIAVCGELIDESVKSTLLHYNIEYINVIDEH